MWTMLISGLAFAAGYWLGGRVVLDGLTTEDEKEIS